MSDMWRLDDGYVAVYTEDKEVMKRISSAQMKCQVMAEYYREGVRFAVQYKVSRRNKEQVEALIGLQA
ncbi:hypothetical protein [Alicyclobacillus fodiniaquatilis]|jgi:hypothetical protein|uniref:Uncharacterized protein n=1 Tax=Alicyclobacillus fodiniaquatilis TaxID=1661150 RepID=A0ABW4JDZ3_9BACL